MSIIEHTSAPSRAATRKEIEMAKAILAIPMGEPIALAIIPGKPSLPVRPEDEKTCRDMARDLLKRQPS
jgi:hypothetical protein